MTTTGKTGHSIYGNRQCRLGGVGDIWDTRGTWKVRLERDASQVVKDLKTGLMMALS